MLFGLLVVATLGAFVVTQRLKTASPVVERIFYPEYLSPNGDRRKDRARIRFELPRADRVTVEMVDAEGRAISRLADGQLMGAGEHGFTWDGSDDTDERAPDGLYQLRVTLSEQGRSVTAPRTVTLDTKPPRPRIVAVTPASIVPGERGRRSRARMRFEPPSDPAPRFTVYRTRGDRARAFDSFEGPRFRRTARWDGLKGGAPVAPGSYALALTVWDAAGNEGRSPARRPPTARDAPPGTGVSVRYLTVAAPLEPVAPGDLARVRLGPRARSVTWSLRRLGSSRTLGRGGVRGARIVLRVPTAARPGLHELRVRAAGRVAVAPLVIGGLGASARRRTLVVLPAITWQARNRVDEDGDGFSDTLADGGRVRVARPFAGGRLPPDLRGQAAPLLRYLDARRRPYELTTDLALARRRGPSLAGRPGVLLAGSATWLPRGVQRALRSYVRGGGRLAALGAPPGQRRAELGGGRLTTAGNPAPTDLFGERTARVASGSGRDALEVLRRGRLDLFAGTGGSFGSFATVERSLRLPRDARLLAAAGTGGRPAFVAYRLRRGLVVRAGSRGWAAALDDGPDVRRVTGRIWALLSS